MSIFWNRVETEPTTSNLLSINDTLQTQKEKQKYDFLVKQHMIKVFYKAMHVVCNKLIISYMVSFSKLQLNLKRNFHKSFLGP